MITARRRETTRHRRGNDGGPNPGGKPDCPNYFSASHRELWKNHIEPAYWLTVVDGPKAIMFVNLLSECLDDPAAMQVSRFRQLRLIATELGLDPPSRSTTGTKHPEPINQFT